MGSTINDFYRGDTKKWNLTFTDKADNPIDLTGASVWFTMKSNKNNADDIADLQVEITTHTDAANGKTQVVLSATETANLKPDTKYYFDFQLVKNGEVTTLFDDNVKVLRDITQSS